MADGRALALGAVVALAVAAGVRDVVRGSRVRLGPLFPPSPSNPYDLRHWARSGQSKKKPLEEPELWFWPCKKLRGVYVDRDGEHDASEIQWRIRAHDLPPPAESRYGVSVRWRKGGSWQVMGTHQETAIACTVLVQATMESLIKHGKLRLTPPAPAGSMVRLGPLFPAAPSDPGLLGLPPFTFSEWRWKGDRWFWPRVPLQGTHTDTKGPYPAASIQFKILPLSSDTFRLSVRWRSPGQLKFTIIPALYTSAEAAATAAGRILLNEIQEGRLRLAPKGSAVRLGPLFPARWIPARWRTADELYAAIEARWARKPVLAPSAHLQEWTSYVFDILAEIDEPEHLLQIATKMLHHPSKEDRAFLAAAHDILIHRPARTWRAGSGLPNALKRRLKHHEGQSAAYQIQKRNAILKQLLSLLDPPTLRRVLEIDRYPWPTFPSAGPSGSQVRLGPLLAPKKRPLPLVEADIQTDYPHTYQARFNAVFWLQQASKHDLQELRDCGWGGDYPADEVARWTMEQRLGKRALLSGNSLREIFNAIEDDGLGFEVRVHEGSAIAWLNAFRPGWGDLEPTGSRVRLGPLLSSPGGTLKWAKKARKLLDNFGQVVEKDETGTAWWEDWGFWDLHGKLLETPGAPFRVTAALDQIAEESTIRTETVEHEVWEVIGVVEEQIKRVEASEAEHQRITARRPKKNGSRVRLGPLLVPIRSSQDRRRDAMPILSPIDKTGNPFEEKLDSNNGTADTLKWKIWPPNPHYPGFWWGAKDADWVAMAPQTWRAIWDAIVRKGVFWELSETGLVVLVKVSKNAYAEVVFRPADRAYTESGTLGPPTSFSSGRKDLVGVDVRPDDENFPEVYTFLVTPDEAGFDIAMHGIARAFRNKSWETG